MIEEILKDSDYKLDLFSKKAIAELETKIIAKIKFGLARYAKIAKIPIKSSDSG